MPKLTTKDSNGPLQEVPLPAMEGGMDLDPSTSGQAGPVLPDKPLFAQLSAKEQSGQKMEFRRVRFARPIACTRAVGGGPLGHWLPTRHFRPAGPRATEPHDSAEDQLDGIV